MSGFAIDMLCLAIERGFESVDDWQNECPRDYKIALEQLVSTYVRGRHCMTRLLHSPTGRLRVNSVVFMRLAMRHPAWAARIAAVLDKKCA